MRVEGFGGTHTCWFIVQCEAIGLPVGRMTDLELYIQGAPALHTVSASCPYRSCPCAGEDGEGPRMCAEARCGRQGEADPALIPASAPSQLRGLEQVTSLSFSFCL